jgi:hypothetical protein
MRSTILALVLSLLPAVALAEDSSSDESGGDPDVAARLEVDRLLASQQREFAGCFEKSLKKGRLISDATLYFKVEPRGKAGSVQIKMPGYAPKQLRQCITRCVEKLSFPLEASFMTVEHRIQIVDSSLDRPQRR